MIRSALRRLRSFIRRLERQAHGEELPLRVFGAEEGSWIGAELGRVVPQLPHGERSGRVEKRARDTQRLGGRVTLPQRLLAEAAGPTVRPPSRTSDQVRTSPQMGRFFGWLVTVRRPAVVVEFGTAFGVSGMYWLSGLERNGAGRLLTFEPNEVWARIAETNLAAIGTRFKLTMGTFEENIDAVLPAGGRIDLAFIDAIHTSAFVVPQFELVAQKLSPGGLVLLDDIDFSPDMRSCWDQIRRDQRLVAAAEVGRVGIVEFRR